VFRNRSILLVEMGCSDVYDSETGFGKMGYFRQKSSYIMFGREDSGRCQRGRNFTVFDIIGGTLICLTAILGCGAFIVHCLNIQFRDDKRRKKYRAKKSVKMKHISGLPGFERGTPVEIFYGDESIFFVGINKEYELKREEISDIKCTVGAQGPEGAIGAIASMAILEGAGGAITGLSCMYTELFVVKFLCNNGKEREVVFDAGGASAKAELIARDYKRTQV